MTRSRDTGDQGWKDQGSPVLNSLADDLTPELGGDLDVNTNSIVGLSATTPMLDTNGNEILSFNPITNASCNIVIENSLLAGAANGPTITVESGVTNTGIKIEQKGAGYVTIGNGNGYTIFKDDTTFRKSCQILGVTEGSVSNAYSGYVSLFADSSDDNLYIKTDTGVVKLVSAGTLDQLLDVELGSPILDTYRLTYDSGTSKWAPEAPTAASSVVATAGTYKKLDANRNGTNTVFITATDLVVTNTDDEPVILNSVSETINAGTTGVNGLDTGSRSSSTWYYMHIIWNGTTTNSLMSLSDDSPTLPSGYTHFARVGMLRTDGASDLKNFEQKNNRCWWRESMNLHTSGTANAWSARTATSVFPPIAKQVTCIMSNHGRDAGLSSESNGRGGSYLTTAAAGANGSFGLWASANRHSTHTCAYASTLYYWQQNAAGDLYAIGWEY